MEHKKYILPSCQSSELNRNHETRVIILPSLVYLMKSNSPWHSWLSYLPASRRLLSGSICAYWTSLTNLIAVPGPTVEGGNCAGLHSSLTGLSFRCISSFQGLCHTPSDLSAFSASFNFFLQSGLPSSDRTMLTFQIRNTLFYITSSSRPPSEV